MRRALSRGFTLLELLVVMILMSLVYALVAVRLDAGSGALDLKGASRQIAAGLRKARSTAIASRAQATLTIDVEKRAFAVSGDPKTYALPKSLEISLFTANSELLRDKAGAIRFFPDGGSTGGRITLAQGGNKQAVDVDWLTGRVAVLQP